MDFVSPETVMGWKFQSYHDMMLVVVVVVLVLVSFYSMVVFRFFGLNKGQMDLSFNKNSILEVAWTLLPGFVLMFVGFISLENLYHFNKTGKIENSFSAVGHQWFWEYVYEVDGKSSKLEKELGAGQFMVLMKQQVWENLMKSMEMMDEKSKSHLVSILASLEKSRGIGDMELKSIETKLDGLLKKLSLAVLESGFDKVLKKEMSIDEFMDRASKKINPIIEESDSVFDSVSSIKQHLMGIGMKKGEMPKEDERSFLGKVFYYFFSWPIHVYNYFFVEESKSDLEQSKMVLGEAKKNNKETFDAHSWLVSHFSPSWLLPSDMTSNKNFTGKYMNSVPLSLNPKAFIEGGSTPCRLRYSSMMVSEEDLTDSKGPSANGFRLMDVTMPCFMKRGVMNEVLVSTVDVMHSWGVPSLGVKVDAVPGRVNSVTCTPENCGLFYGFCYELCGAGHSKMPIGAAVLELNDFNDCLQMLVMKESSLKFDSDFKDISPGPDFWDTKPDQTIHEPAHFILGSGVMSPIGTLLCILFMEVMLLNGGVLSLINILFVMMHFYLQEGLTEEVSDIMRGYVSWLHELQERWEDVENHSRELEARNRNLQNLVNLLNGEEGGLGFSRSSDSAIHSPDFSPDQTSVMSEEVLVHYEPGDFIPRFLEDDRRSSSLDTIMSWDSEELEMLYSLSQEGLTNTDVTGVDHDVNWSDVTTPSTGWKAMFGRQISNMTSFVSNLASSIFTKMSEMGFRFGPVVSEDAPGSDSSDNWSTTSEWTTDDEAGGSPTPPTFVPRRGPNGETSLFNLTVEELLAKQNSGKLSSEELELLEKVTEKPSRGLKKSKSLSDMSDLVKPEKEGDIMKSQSLTSCFNEDINNNLPMGFKKTSLSESSSFTVSNSSDLATQENLPETSEGLKPGDLSEKTSGHGSSVEVSSSSSSEGIFDAVGAMATVDLIHTEEEKVNVDKNDIEENKSSEEKKSEYSPDDGEEPSCSHHYSDEPASSMSSKPDTGVGKASSISTLDELKVDSSIPLPPKSKSTGDPVVVEDIVPLKDQKSSQFANFSNLVTAVTSSSDGSEVTERRSISTLSELKKEDSSSSLRKTKSEGDLSKVKEIIPLKNQQSSQFADLSTFVGAKSKDSGSSEVIGSKSIGTIEELKPVDRSYSLRESKSTGDLSKVKEDPFITMKDSNGPLIPKSNSLSNLDDLKTDDSPSLRKSMSASDISKISNLTPLKDQKSSQLSTCENLLDTSQSGSERWVDATSSLGGSTSSVNSSPEESKVSSLASAQGLPSGSAPSASEALSASVSEVAGCSMESTSKDSSSLSGSVPSTSKALSTSVSEVAGCSMESTSKDSSSLSGSVPSTSKALSTSVSEVAGCSMESTSKDSSSLGGSVPSTSEALSASVSEVVGCLMESTFKDSSSPSGSAPQTSETLSAEVSEVAGCSKEGNSISEDQKTSHPPNQVSWEQGEMDKEKKSSLTNLELEKEGFKGSVKSMSMSDVSGLSGGSSEFSEYKYGLLRKWKSMENLADWKQGFKLKSASDLVPFAQDSSKDLWWDGEKLYFMASSKSGSFDSIMAKISDLEMMLLEMSASKSLKISGSSKSGETSSFLLLKKESSSESFIWDKGAENPLSPSSSGGKNNPPLLGLKHLEWKKGVTGTSTPKLNEDKPGPSGYVDSPDPRPIMSILSLDDKSESLPSFSLSGEMDRLINFPKSSSIDNSKGKLSEDINKLTYSFSVMKINEQESKDFSPSSLPKECFELETPNDSDSLNNLKNKKILLIPLSGNEGFSTLKSQKDSYKIVDVSLSSSGSSFELSKGKSMLNEVSKAILTKNSLSMCLDSEKSEESSSLGAVGGVKNFPSNSVSESVSNLAVGFKEEDSLPIVKNTDSDLQVSLSVSSSSKMS